MSCGLDGGFRCVIILQHCLEYFIAWFQHLLMDSQMFLLYYQHITLEVSKIKLNQATCQILVLDTVPWNEQAEIESAAGGIWPTPPVKQQEENGPMRSTALWMWEWHQMPLSRREKEKDPHWRARQGDKSQDVYEGMSLREETEKCSRREIVSTAIYGKCSSKEISLLTRQQVHSSAGRKYLTIETSDCSRDTCLTLLV